MRLAARPPEAACLLGAGALGGATFRLAPAPRPGAA
jgi:hypothetical protein